MFVARDKTGNLYLFGRKPERTLAYWASSGFGFPLNNADFPDLKWEDEPMEVIIIEKVPSKAPLRYVPEDTYGMQPQKVGQALNYAIQAAQAIETKKYFQCTCSLQCPTCQTVLNFEIKEKV